MPNATQVHLNGAAAFKRAAIIAQAMRHKGSQPSSGPVVFDLSEAQKPINGSNAPGWCKSSDAPWLVHVSYAPFRGPTGRHAVDAAPPAGSQRHRPPLQHRPSRPARCGARTAGWSTLGRLNTLTGCSRSICSIRGVSAASMAPMTITERSSRRTRLMQMRAGGGPAPTRSWARPSPGSRAQSAPRPPPGPVQLKPGILLYGFSMMVAPTGNTPML